MRIQIARSEHLLRDVDIDRLVRVVDVGQVVAERPDPEHGTDEQYRAKRRYACR